VVYPHGSVVPGEDNCVINIGFMRAHFTIYQQSYNVKEEYCEDIPLAGETEFHIEYLHNYLNKLDVEFRVIRDINEFGKFVNWEDIQSLTNIEEATVLYVPPTKYQQGEVTIPHTFQQDGSHIGIVTATNLENGKKYRAIFQFQVGGGRYPYLLPFLFLIVILQAVFWVSKGGFKRFNRHIQNEK
jgi:hypothetical protein